MSKASDVSTPLQREIRRVLQDIAELRAAPERNERALNDRLKAYAALVNQERAIQKEVLRKTRRMTSEQIEEVIDDWFASLPHQQQRLRIQAFTRIHNGERSTG